MRKKSFGRLSGLGRKAGVIVLLSAASAVSSGAYAQQDGYNDKRSYESSRSSYGTTEDPETFELNPVVVTGTGTVQRLKNSPAPVQIITAGEIKKAGISDIQQALTMMVPSISFRPNAMGSYLMMNGLSNKHILILVNGRKLTGDISGNIDLGQIDLSRVSRIEVLGGAASSLYGSDAIGGVINLITNDPKETVSFTSSSSYTRKNQFDQSLGLDIAQGKTGSYTSFKFSHSDGWQNNRFTEGSDGLTETLAPLSIGFNSRNLSQKFTFDASERLSFYINGSYYNKILDRPVTRDDIAGGSKYNTAYEGYNWGAGALYKLSEKNSLQFDYSGSDYKSRYKYLVESGEYLPGDYALTKAQKNEEAELKGIFGFAENNTTVIGASFRKETLGRPDSDLDKSVSTASAYVQHEIKFLDHFTAIAGVRLDSHKETGTRLTPKTAIMYSAGNFNARATYAAGFRSPGIDELYYHMFKKDHGSKTTITLGNPDLSPEKSNYYSLNAEYRSDKFSISVTGYINKVKDMVTYKSTSFSKLDPERQEALRAEFPEIEDLSSTKNLSVKEYFNFEEAKIKGVEINLSARILPELTLSGNYAWAYGRGLNSDGTWQNIERSIRNTATITGNWAHSWKSYTFNVNLSARMQGKVLYPSDADGNAPGYGVWNITTRHTFDCFNRFTVEPGIGMENIFNRKDNRPLNKNFALYSPGRSITLSLILKIK